MRSKDTKQEHLRQVVEKLTKMMANRDVKVTQRGTKAYCRWNTKTHKLEQINLPVIPPDPSETFIAALHGYLDHEVAHALFTSPKEWMAIEKDSELEVNKSYRRNVVNIVEDVRIENCMAKSFAGTLPNMEATRQFVIDTIWGPSLDELNPSAPDYERQVATLAFVPFMRSLGGHKACEEFVATRKLDAPFASIMAAIPDLGARLKALRSTEEAAKLAEELLAIMTPPESDAGEGEEDEDGSEGSESDEAEEGEPGEDSKKGKSKSKKKPKDREEDEDGEDADASAGSEPDKAEDKGDEDEGKPEDGEQDDSAEGKSGSQSGDVSSSPVDIDLSGLSDMDSDLDKIINKTFCGVFTDDVQTDYSRDFDRIEFYPSKGDVGDISRIEDSVRKHTGVMQKELQRLIVAKTRSYNVGGFRSGRLNAPALHRHASGDDRLFRRKVTHTTNEVAMSLVVDCSGSMGNASKIQTALKAAWAFADVLDRLKIPNEVIGFTTTGFANTADRQDVVDGLPEMMKATGLPQYAIRCQPVYIPIFKAFSERFTVEPKRRMARLMKERDILNGNNDALGVEYAGQRLLPRTEPRKIMIVFSDGMPSDGDVHDPIIGATLKRNIARLERGGVEVIGVGIKDTSVRHFYKKVHVIENVSDLPSFVMRELKKLLNA